MYRWREVQHASFVLSLRFIFPVWKWCAKMPQKKRQFYLWTTCESFKDVPFHQFPVLVISRKCNIKIEKWAHINPDKSGHAFAEWQRNPWSFNSILIFTMIIFVWIFFKNANFVIFTVGFLAWSLNIFRGIIGIKIEISIVCLEKTSCKNPYQIGTGQLVSTVYKRRI